jgi:transcriptional regulator
MNIIQIINKGQLIDTIEKYYFYKVKKEGIQLNHMHTNNKNLIFETLYNQYK